MSSIFSFGGGGNFNAEYSNITLLASGWSDGVYTISDPRITASSVQSFSPQVGITSEQLEALQGANIVDYGQSEGQAQLKAYGDVPEINIPITVVFTPGIQLKEVENSNTSFPNAGSHNSIFRGKYLGASLTTTQAEEISAGTFNDLYVGDYWTINSVNWRIAGFDIFLHRGDTAFNKHHIVVVPDTNLYNAQMNTSNTTTGGYYNSAMRTSNLANAETAVTNAFGSDHVLTHRVLLTNAVSGDAPSGWAWYDSKKCELMTEAQVYGQYNWAQHAQNGYESGIDYDQLPLFSLAPEFICNRAYWWLRSVRSSARFASVDLYGVAAYDDASDSVGVRPLTLIG